MAEQYGYAPPTGPPPPQVPPGWKAQYNEQYHEWYGPGPRNYSTTLKSPNPRPWKLNTDIVNQTQVLR
jgi:hypothetical protein